MAILACLMITVYSLSYFGYSLSFCHPSDVYGKPTVRHGKANRYGTPKKQKKTKKNSVGHFCGKHAMGAKKSEMFHFFCSFVLFCLWPPTEMTHFCRWPQEKHRPTELFTPFEALYKICL